MTAEAPDDVAALKALPRRDAGRARGVRGGAGRAHGGARARRGGAPAARAHRGRAAPRALRGPALRSATPSSTPCRSRTWSWRRECWRRPRRGRTRRWKRRAPCARPVKRNRGRLPAHLPRVERVIEPGSTSCPCGCGPMARIGEDVSERLDIVPAQFRVLVTRRPTIRLPALLGRGRPGACARARRAGRAAHRGADRPRRRLEVRQTTCRSTARHRSTPAKGSISTAPRSAPGQAAPCFHLQPVVERMREHTRPRRAALHGRDHGPGCSIRDGGAPGGASSGPSPRTTAATAAPDPPVVIFRYAPGPRGRLGRGFPGGLPRPPAAMRRLRGLRAPDADHAAPGPLDARPLLEPPCVGASCRWRARPRSPVAEEALTRIGALYAVEEGRARPAPGGPPRRAAGPLGAHRRRAEALARGAALMPLLRIEARRAHPLRPLPLGGAHALPGRRPFGARHQPRREPHPSHRDEAFILPLLLKCMGTLGVGCQARCDAGGPCAAARSRSARRRGPRRGSGRARPARPARPGAGRPG